MSDTALMSRLLEAAKLHVPFDGWSETTLRMAAADAGIDPGLIPAICPRGAVDLALAFTKRATARCSTGCARPI